MPALQGELNKMAEIDQSVRSGGFKVLSDQEKRDRLEEVDAKNLRRIKAIVEAHGLPTPALVGYDGVGSFWLLTQHATDYEFQDRVLTQIEKLGSESGVSAQQIAMLRDRILVRKGLPQRYGTQFKLMFENGAVEPYPIENPEHVDDRRKQIGLMSMVDYKCVLTAVSTVQR